MSTLRLLTPLVCVAMSGCALFTLAATDKSHPPLEGLLKVEKSQDTLRIRRDLHGVPHIDASSESDAWYGLGFVHGQDRLFQADLSRHLAYGRVSEWVGEGAVDTDAFLASMRLKGRAREAFEGLGSDEQEMLRAYANGLNEGVESLKTLPVEYRLLGVDFEPWAPEDCYAILYLMSWQLSGNLKYELAAVQMRDVDPTTVDALFRTYDSSPDFDAYWDDYRIHDYGEWTPGFDGFTSALGGRPNAEPPSAPDAEASNNWVVSGEKTASGKPLLANDPHLVQSVPSLWYVAHLKGGDLEVAGATLAGTPGVPIGHNGTVAWGLTNVMADVVDVAILNRSGPNVIVGEDTVPLDMREVTVTPRKGKAVTRTVPWSPVGPLINEGGTHALALRWQALELDERTPELLRLLATAESAEETAVAARGVSSGVVQNVVLADVDGGWGWQVIGSVPVRKQHSGRVPYPASDPAHGWDGWRTDLPSTFTDGAARQAAATDGFVVTANSRPDHPDADAISTGFIPPTRYDRIHELLSESDSLTSADMHRIQLDVQDGVAVAHLDRLLEGVTPEGTGERCYAELNDWDRRVTTDSRGAVVWAAFQEALLREVVGDQLSEQQILWTLQTTSQGRHWLFGGFYEQMDDRPATVTTALTKACNRLLNDLGEPEAWTTWGELHPLDLNHPFGNRSGLLDGWNMPEVPFPGSGATVAAAKYEWHRPLSDWKVTGMASLRLVVPMDDPSKATLVHPGGQSGQPGHPLYQSHFDAFVRGETLPLWTDEKDIADHVAHSLTLQP